MKKRILALLGLALVLTLCLLAGCNGGNQTGTDTGTATGTDTGTDTAEPATGTATEPDTDTATDPDTATETTTGADTEPATTDYFSATKIDLVEPDTSLVPDMAVADDGYDVYLLTNGGRGWGYRYGCTYLYNPDGSIDAYFASDSAGNASEWDWISYRHSPDGGTTWENEKIVLTPTQNSMDHFSNCDPGVVYFNGYYYLGYTSTLNSSGLCNNLFVARSRTPDGPFEKWNGNGWGGPDCQPVIYYDETWESWGVGEPSFVEVNGTLYIYYTNTAPSGGYTMVATADATDENWPATVQLRGKAYVKGSNDSLDVKYVEEWGKFVGVGTSSRMSTDSWLAVYASNDGITFELVDCVKEGTYQYLHNAGLSSRRNGRIRLSEDADKLRVVYAYGEVWGAWNTRVQPVTLTLSTGNDISAERFKANLPDPHLRTDLIPSRNRYVAMIRPEQDVYEYPLSQGEFQVQLYAYDTYYERSRYRKEVTYSDYDTNVIRFENNKAIIVGVGETSVTVTAANGVKNIFWVRITDGTGGDGSTATEFMPVRGTYTIYDGESNLFRPQIRGRIKWDNGKITERLVDEQTANTVTFTGYDDSVISVSAVGIITARKVGETDVTVTWNGLSFVTHVVVTDDRSKAYYSLGQEETLDYTALDFTKKETQAVISDPHSTIVSLSDQGTGLTVTGGDPYVWILYSQSGTVIDTSEYSAVEITYMVPAGVSEKAEMMQVFIVCDALSEASSIKLPIVADGEYHTVRLELAGKAYWHDTLRGFRFDYFAWAPDGTTLYLKAITLIK